MPLFYTRNHPVDVQVALFFRPDITKVELRVEREQVQQAREMAGAVVNGRGRQAQRHSL